MLSFGKPRYIANVCRRKVGKTNVTPKFDGHCYIYNKYGHQEFECRSKLNKTLKQYKFDGYCYTYNKYGHKAYDCRSQKKKKWKSSRQGNTTNWDYNTWITCRACRRYGHIAKNS